MKIQLIISLCHCLYCEEIMKILCLLTLAQFTSFKLWLARSSCTILLLNELLPIAVDTVTEKQTSWMWLYEKCHIATIAVVISWLQMLERRWTSQINSTYSNCNNYMFMKHYLYFWPYLSTYYSGLSLSRARQQLSGQQ